MFAAFLFFDVVHVGVPKDGHDEEAKEHVPVREVIKSVWLVPVRKLSDILMRKGSFVSYLKFTIAAERS